METAANLTCRFRKGDGLTGCLTCGGPDPRRGFCSSKCRQAWRVEHVWDVARLHALARAGWACSVCGVVDGDSMIEVHHVVPVNTLTGYRTSCEHHATNLAVLCHDPCHLAAHRALRAEIGEQLSLVMAA